MTRRLVLVLTLVAALGGTMWRPPPPTSTPRPAWMSGCPSPPCDPGASVGQNAWAKAQTYVNGTAGG